MTCCYTTKQIALSIKNLHRNFKSPFAEIDWVACILMPVHEKQTIIVCSADT
jgi:hypothetical protein